MDEIRALCHTVIGVLQSQPAMVDVQPPVILCGDIHGQFGDLMRIFTHLGMPPTSNYLFLGDYVDRGAQSLEVIVLLFCFKVGMNCAISNWVLATSDSLSWELLSVARQPRMQQYQQSVSHFWNSADPTLNKWFKIWFPGRNLPSLSVWWARIVAHVQPVFRLVAILRIGRRTNSM